MQQRKRGNTRERGAALVAVMVVVVALATMAATLLLQVGSSTREERTARELETARLVSEAGLNAAFANMQAGMATELGNEQFPVAFGGGEFFVESEDLGNGATRLVAMGNAANRTVMSELVVKQVATGSPVYGVFGDEMLEINSNAFVDSYKSSLGSYESQAIYSNGNDTWALGNGHIGSNANIYVSQNSGVHGNATPGVEKSVVLSGTAEIHGTTTPAEVDFVFPELSVPSEESLSGNMTIKGDKTLGPGTYYLNSLTLNSNSSLDVTGPVTFVLGSMELRSNAELLVDATNGGAEFYVYGDFELQSNTLLAATDYDPQNLAVNLRGNNVIDPSVDVEIDEDLDIGFKSNSKMYGMLFAPKALIEIRSNFELYGSLMARRLLISSNAMIHYDESLSETDEDVEMTYEVVGWRSVPVTP